MGPCSHPVDFFGWASWQCPFCLAGWGSWHPRKGDAIIFARRDWRWGSSQELASNQAAHQGCFWRVELKENCKALPHSCGWAKKSEAAILLIVWFLMMCLACTCLHLIFSTDHHLTIFCHIVRNLSHELPETIQSIEKAIDFDIAELLESSKKLALVWLRLTQDSCQGSHAICGKMLRNANFAFSSPLYMGHKNYMDAWGAFCRHKVQTLVKLSVNYVAMAKDVNTFADWYSWMHLGFSDTLQHLFLACHDVLHLSAGQGESTSLRVRPSTFRWSIRSPRAQLSALEQRPSWKRARYLSPNPIVL